MDLEQCCIVGVSPLCKCVPQVLGAASSKTLYGEMTAAGLRSLLFHACYRQVQLVWFVELQKWLTHCIAQRCGLLCCQETSYDSQLQRVYAHDDWPLHRPAADLFARGVVVYATQRRVASAPGLCLVPVPVRSR